MRSGANIRDRAVSAESLCNVRILVVDDNDHMRNLLRAMLFAFGFKSVQSEEDGRTALTAMQSLKPDIIVTDYSMHPVDGIEFVKAVRALNSPMAWTPVIMVTGHKERHYVEKARDAGVTELLSKPVTARDLFLRIREVIERPRPFIRAPGFSGPDRRRRKIPPAMMKKRRQSDQDVELVNS
jgi:CheY-like chemotaxis protein